MDPPHKEPIALNEAPENFNPEWIVPSTDSKVRYGSSVAVTSVSSRAGDRSYRGEVIFLTCLVVLSTTFLTAGLAVYLWVVHTTYRDGWDLISTADLQFLVTISQVMSTLLPKTVPIVMSIYTYRVAAIWLAQAGDSLERPTPLQLGLLLSLIQGANYSAFFSAWFHLWRKTDASRRQNIRAPAVLKNACGLLGVLLAFSYLTIGFDTWLHASSAAIAVNVTNIYHAIDQADFGRRINATRCQLFSSRKGLLNDTDPVLADLCGLVSYIDWSTLEYSWPQMIASLPEGARVLSNSSNFNRLAFTDDQTVIVLPNVLPQGQGFEALTIGVHSECQSITNQCVSPIQNTPVLPYYDCNGIPTVTLNNTFVQSTVPYLISPLFGVVNDTGFVADQSPYPSSSAVQSNPFSVVSLVASHAYDDIGTGNTGFFSYKSMSSNLLYCTMHVLDLSYRYDPLPSNTTAPSTSDVNGTFHILSSVHSPIRTAKLVAAMFDTSWVGMEAGLRAQGAGLTSGLTYAEVYASQLSWSALGASASIFEGTPVDKRWTVSSKIGSRIRIVPLILTYVMPLLLCVCALAVAERGLRVQDMTCIHQAHTHLTSTTSFLNSTFGSGATGDLDDAEEKDILTQPSLRLGPFMTERQGRAFGVHISSHDEQQSTTGAPLSTSPSASPLDIIIDDPELGEHLTRSSKEARSPSITSVTIGLWTLLVVLVTLSPLSAVLIYTCGIHRCYRTASTIHSTSSLSSILTLSQVTSTMVSLTAPVVLGVYSISVASTWLTATKKNRETSWPSATQLGLIRDIFQSANVKALFQGARLITPSDRSGPPPTAYLLRRAVWALAALLVLSNLTSIFDTWFHASASPELLYLQGPTEASAISLYGRQLNSTRCTEFQEPSQLDLCGQYIKGRGLLTALPEGLRTVAKSSPLHAVAFTEDQHAILVPASMPVGISYVADAVGVYSSCKSITRQCVVPSNTTSETTFGTPWFKCTGSPEVQLDNSILERASDGYIFGVLNQTGHISDGVSSQAFSDAKTNPFQVVGTVVSWGDASDQQDWWTSSGYFYGIRGLFGWNVLYCDVHVRDLRYSYDSLSQAFTVLNMTDAPLRTTKIIAAMADSNFTRLYQQVLIDGGGTASGEYAAEYGLELSRELLALNAAAFEPLPAQDVVSIQAMVGSRVQIIPFALFSGTVSLFCLYAVFIAGISAASLRSEPFVSLGQLRVSSRLPTIHLRFGPVDPQRTWTDDGPSLFSPESDKDRLNMGFLREVNGQLVFDIAKSEQCLPEDSKSSKESELQSGMPGLPLGDDIGLNERVSTRRGRVLDFLWPSFDAAVGI